MLGHDNTYRYPDNLAYSACHLCGVRARAVNLYGTSTDITLATWIQTEMLPTDYCCTSIDCTKSLVFFHEINRAVQQRRSVVQRNQRHLTVYLSKQCQSNTQFVGVQL
jgi:hypothetical protein